MPFRRTSRLQSERKRQYWARGAGQRFRGVSPGILTFRGKKIVYTYIGVPFFDIDFFEPDRQREREREREHERTTLFICSIVNHSSIW